MNQDELQDRILMFNHLEGQEMKPASPYDPSEGMNKSELRNFVRFLYGQVTEKDKAIQEVLEELRGMRRDYSDLSSRFDSLTRQFEKVLLENRDLKEQLGVLKSDHYGSSKSRKGIVRNRRSSGKHDGPDNTNSGCSSSCTSSDNNTQSVEYEKHESGSVYHGPSRKGATYNKSVVGEPVVHKCTLDKLPAGAVVLKVMKPKVIRTVVNYIEEHHFERVKVKSLFWND